MDVMSRPSVSDAHLLVSAANIKRMNATKGEQSTTISTDLGIPSFPAAFLPVHPA